MASDGCMIIVKNASELSRMRVSGQVAARVRDRVAERVEPGVSTLELSEYAGSLMKEMGAVSAFLGYRGYPGVICISVNDEVVHGIPGERRVQLGDIVSIDVGVVKDGFVGDTATTVLVGVTDAKVVQLVRATQAALFCGIAMARSGHRLGDVSHAIELAATEAGFSVVRDYVGHGIGRKMHEDPQIPNFGAEGKGPKLRAGMTLALEPMVNMGGSGVHVDPDGWTVRTLDGLPSAHFEHTVAVGPDGVEILTE